MSKEHHYELSLKWTGNKGVGTQNYTSYDRSHVISGVHKNEIGASSDPAFRGDPTLYNPEELLVASLSSCHMLWFLHLCADSGIVVTDYTDHPTGTMVETASGGGHFKEVVLHPVVTVKGEDMVDKLEELHKRASALCFIANSVNFVVKHDPKGRVEN